MKSGYKCSAKRIAAIGVMLCMLVLTCLTVTSVLNTKAEESIGQGHVNYDVTDLRIRTSPVSGSVITKVDGGFKFDIYEEVDTSSGLWYGIGFYLNGDYYRGYVTSEYVTVDKRNDYKPDADFEEYLDSQGFPDSYKDGLRQLHAQYPNWVFVADHNGKDWSDVLENQNVIGRSLTYGSAKSSWKSVADGCYDWESGQYTQLDSGGWVQASSALVEYALDPRNFLNADNIFMFENLSFDSSLQDESGLESMVDGTFMENSSHDLTYDGRNYTYITGLLLAGQESGVSPYHLASRILQEQGNSGYGSSISGTQSGYYWGYYNYYNIGAYASGGLTAVQNGLKYASYPDSSTLRPWNTRMKSIIGGAIYLGKSYINRGQNTLYYEKFDMTGRGHQYMTNVLAPRSESVKSAQGYSDSNKNNIAFIFRIPVYENMPENVCEIPTGNGSPNNRLESLYVEDYSITPTFSYYTTEYSLIVDYETSSVYVGGSALDSSADVSGLGYHDLSVGSNDITITVTAANGDEQNYVITVVREDKEPDPEPGPGPEPEPDVTYPGFSTDLFVDEDERYITGINVSEYTGDVLDRISNYDGAYSKILNKNGNEKDGLVGTGDILITYNSSGEEVSRYEIILYGDVNGDGEIDLFDFVAVKRSILGIADPLGVYWKAADCNRDGEIDLFDFVAVKRCILGLGSVKQ